jgi:hypothetical protein
MIDKFLGLQDYAYQSSKNISIFVENQFPSIYKEEAQELIELVKAYYSFLETFEDQATYNVRRMYQYRDIDTTIDSMLLFFKNKFLNGIFFDADTPFIIKNILSLYRRKGSKEGIELFFALFFQSEVSIYFPSDDIFKPSNSTWKVGNYLQLYPIKNHTVLPNIKGLKLFGSLSNAEAFVDNVYFITINNSVIPIIFISNTKGDFIRFDTIYSKDPDLVLGTLYGSLRNVILDSNVEFTTENIVGDIVEIRSSEGKNGIGRVTKVTQNLSGEVQFNIVDGGFGYTIANTDIILSEQTLFLDNVGSGFSISEKIKQVNEANTEIEATVIGIDKRNNSIGIILDNINLPFNQGTIETINRSENESFNVLFNSPVNNSASANVGTIKDTENVTVITDIISDFLLVPINSANYSFVPPALKPMSGTTATGIQPNLNTPLNIAFSPTTFTIGTIESLTNINPGNNYVTDAFVLAKENTFNKFNLNNQVLRIISSVGVNILEGDIITQQKTVKTFEGAELQVIVRGKVVSVEGNNITIRQLTFQPFSISRDVVTQELLLPAFKEGLSIPLDIQSITFDRNSNVLGLNAVITGLVGFSVGKISDIEIIDSGLGYEHEKPIEIYNITKAERLNQLPILDASGRGVVNRLGITEGKWITTNSNINTEKVIQDSFYYQDYSYEISTDISPTIYENIYKEISHPSGIKLFTKFRKTDTIDFTPNIFQAEIKKFTVQDSVINEDSQILSSDNGFLYLITQLIEE